MCKTPQQDREAHEDHEYHDEDIARRSEPATEDVFSVARHLALELEGMADTEIRVSILLALVALDKPDLLHDPTKWGSLQVPSRGGEDANA